MPMEIASTAALPAESPRLGAKLRNGTVRGLLSALTDASASSTAFGIVCARSVMKKEGQRKDAYKQAISHQRHSLKQSLVHPV